jgi:DNA-directed RNA polymerase subunit RPC12/RpoP
MLSERDALASRPRPLTCVGCGERFTPTSAARGTCPHCGMPGYVDRAGRHFLPLGWTCDVCGAANSGAENGAEAICAACGARRGRMRHPAKAGWRDAPPPERTDPAAVGRTANRITLIAGLALAGALVGWGAVALAPVAARWWAASSAAAWLGVFAASLADLPGPDDPEYTYLFATVVFQIALLPVAIYLLVRLIRRLFP